MFWGRVVLGREASAGQQYQLQGLNTVVPHVLAAVFLPPKTPPKEKWNLYKYPSQTAKKHRCQLNRKNYKANLKNTEL